MIIQHVFTDANMNKLYLSPYVLTLINGNNLVFTNAERKKVVKLTIKESPVLILELLNDGIDPDSFLKVLKKQLATTEKDAKSVLQLLISEKILD